MKERKKETFVRTDIILKTVSFWVVPLIRILRYFKFNIYYLHVDANSDIKKNKIASKLKKINIFPLPIEFEKNILPRADCSSKQQDPDQFTYSYNLRLIPDTFLILSLSQMIRLHQIYNNIFCLKH